MKLALTLFTTLLLTGCAATSTQPFYWGNYSSTLYKAKSTPNDKNRQAHIEQLEKIIEKSNEKSLQVPPGIHVELGYRYATIARFSDAETQYNAELKLYPESAVFVGKLKQQLEEQSAKEPGEER